MYAERFAGAGRLGKAAEEWGVSDASEVEASTIHLASWLASRGRFPLPMVMEELSLTMRILWRRMLALTNN
jgi:hypothetical protein